MQPKSFWKIVDGRIVTGHIDRNNAFVDVRPGILTYSYNRENNTAWVTAHPAKGVNAQPITLPATVIDTVDWIEGFERVLEVAVVFDGKSILLRPAAEDRLFVPKSATNPPPPRISLLKLMGLVAILAAMVPIGLALGWDNGFFTVLGRMTAVTFVFLLLFGFREKPKS